MNMILNVSIGLVALLILVVSVNLFTNGSDNIASENNANNQEASANNEELLNNNDISIDSNTEEENSTENLELNTEDEDAETNNENDLENENNPENNNEENNNENNINNSNEENNTNENNNNTDNNEENNNSEENNNEENNNEENNENNSSNGEWGPVGTVQDEPFTPVYDSNHVNWEEMIRAISAATGLPENEEDLIVWRIENAGGENTAVGTVSERGSDYSSPHRVTITWVEEEGWMPVEAERLNSNPYN